MVDVKELLRDMIRDLCERHGFEGQADQRLIRAKAVSCANSIEPAQVMIAWLQRCPEALAFLDEALNRPPPGLDPGPDGAPDAPAPDPTAKAPPAEAVRLPADQIWSFVFGRLQPVKLVGAVGPILKVEELAAAGKVGRRADQTLAAVPWWARDDARRKQDQMPGAREPTAWADELDFPTGESYEHERDEEGFATPQAAAGRGPLGLDPVLLEPGGPGDGVLPHPHEPEGGPQPDAGRDQGHGPGGQA